MDTDEQNDDIIVPTSGPPKVADPAPGHPRLFSGDCSICMHEYRAGIEELYLGFRTLKLISDVACVTEAAIEKHAIALGLDKKRADNTEELTRHALNKSFDRGVMDNLDGDQTIKLLQWAEKRMGKVKERNDERPPAVVIVGVPMVGRPMLAQVAPAPRVIQGTIVNIAKPLPFPKAEG